MNGGASNWITAAATVVMAFTTIAYTWGTLRLWRTTRDALRLTFLQAFRGAPRPGAPFEQQQWMAWRELLVRTFPDLARELSEQSRQASAAASPEDSRP